MAHVTLARYTSASTARRWVDAASAYLEAGGRLLEELREQQLRHLQPPCQHEPAGRSQQPCDAASGPCGACTCCGGLLAAAGAGGDGSACSGCSGCSRRADEAVCAVDVGALEAEVQRRRAALEAADQAHAAALAALEVRRFRVACFCARPQCGQRKLCVGRTLTACGAHPGVECQKGAAQAAAARGLATAAAPAGRGPRVAAAAAAAPPGRDQLAAGVWC